MPHRTHIPTPGALALLLATATVATATVAHAGLAPAGLEDSRVRAPELDVQGADVRPEDVRGLRFRDVPPGPVPSERVPSERVPSERVPSDRDPPEVAPSGRLPFQGIAVGVSRSADIARRLDPPTRLDSGAERFVAEAKGVSEALVGYEDGGIVLWARIRTVKKLSSETAALVFALPGNPRIVPGDPLGSRDPDLEPDADAAADPDPDPAGDGRTEVHDDEGVLLHVEGQEVRHVWMVRPGSMGSGEAPIEDLRRRIAAASGSLGSGVSGPGEAGSSSPGFDLAGSGAAGPAPPPANAAVQVFTLACIHNVERNGVDIHAHVEIRGMNGRPMAGWCLLRLPDGTHLAAPADAPDSWRDPRGFLRPASGDTIRFDVATWNPFRIFVPYSAMRTPAGTRTVTAAFFASAGPLEAMLARDLELPVNQLGPPVVFRPPGPGREIRFGPSRVDPNARDAAGAAAIKMEVEVLLQGMRGKTLRADLHLKRPDGTYVRPAPGADRWRDELGNFASADRNVIQFDETRFPAYTLAARVADLELPPGRHTLIAELMVICDGLAGTVATACVVEKP